MQVAIRAPRLGQRLVVRLARRGSRQRPQHDEGRRDHVVRQALLEGLPERSVRRAGQRHRHDIGHQLRVSHPTRARDDHRLLDRPEATQGGLDLDEIDTVAPNLHAGVLPPQAHERAVWLQATQIAGVVATGPARCRSRPEGSGGQVGATPVLQTEKPALHDDLTHLTWRHLSAGVVQQEHGLVFHRVPDGNQVAGHSGLVVDREEANRLHFARSQSVDEPAVRREVAPVQVEVARLDGLAPQPDHAKRGEPRRDALEGVAQRAEERCSHDRDGDALSAQQRHHRVRAMLASVMRKETGPAEHAQEDVLDRLRGGEREQGETILRAHLERVDVVARVVDPDAVVAHGPLGPAGRARRVEDHRRIFRCAVHRGVVLRQVSVERVQAGDYAPVLDDPVRGIAVSLARDDGSW
jgi:hypothetical protein